MVKPFTDHPGYKAAMADLAAAMPPPGEDPKAVAQLLNEQDQRYNRQTNELIARHVERLERVRQYERQRAVDILGRERDRTRKRLARDPAERDRTLALLTRLKKAICDSPTTTRSDS